MTLQGAPVQLAKAPARAEPQEKQPCRAMMAALQANLQMQD